MPQFSSDRPLKSKVSHLKNLSLLNFQHLDPKYDLAVEPKVLELEGSSFGIRPYAMRPPPLKSTFNSDFGEKMLLAPHTDSLF